MKTRPRPKTSVGVPPGGIPPGGIGSEREDTGKLEDSLIRGTRKGGILTHESS